ncbi:DNA/RNA nuclease SfsA [Desulfovirgula thermocuniculi]|uniref:DNA/RNA nuclease SfsA n=1 Tax=Desulfovirgula thermocuniculi TaxID=348842 RepID=UPI001B7FA79D|nr:DNA/RNA nuclease SfsA [Desulfovirgula thermocuniculi]
MLVYCGVSALAKYPLPPGLKEALFLSRPNRFTAVVEVDGQRDLAHVPSSGRMAGLLVPGTRVYLSRREARGGKTAWRLVLAEQGGLLVSVDAGLPNRLIKTALEARVLEPFSAYTAVRPECRFAAERFDFCLEGPPGRCLVEVKSVTLVREGLALFPDAPTARGARHLAGLARAASRGYRAAVLFVVQREDARAFAPHAVEDPAFARALKAAAFAGVEVRAYRCRITLKEVALSGEIPVILGKKNPP